MGQVSRITNLHLLRNPGEKRRLFIPEAWKVETVLDVIQYVANDIVASIDEQEFRDSCLREIANFIYGKKTFLEGVCYQLMEVSVTIHQIVIFFKSLSLVIYTTQYTYSVVQELNSESEESFFRPVNIFDTFFYNISNCTYFLIIILNFVLKMYEKSVTVVFKIQKGFKKCRKKCFSKS